MLRLAFCLACTPVQWSRAALRQYRHSLFVRQYCRKLLLALMARQLNDCLNSKGETFVLALNNLLNDCECSKPNS